MVCLHISAYGRDNERADWPGYDYLMQAEVGLMSLTGEPDGPPARVGASIVDSLTGLTGIVGLLSCVMQARRTGRGCDVDTCLFDVAMHQLTYSALWYLNEGHTSHRLPRSAHLSQVPVQTFPTADGWVFIMCMTEKFWRILCDVIGRPDLPQDHRFATAESRRENRDALTALLDAELRKQTTQHWLALLTGKIPIAPVYDLAQALDAPFTAPYRHGAQHRASGAARAARARQSAEARRGAAGAAGLRFAGRGQRAPFAAGARDRMKLGGLKVIELSWFLPGPFLAMALADHGAEVIKVEPPGEGDPGRHIAPMDARTSAFFRNLNRGKKSVVIDLKTAAGREAVLLPVRSGGRGGGVVSSRRRDTPGYRLRHGARAQPAHRLLRDQRLRPGRRIRRTAGA